MTYDPDAILANPDAHPVHKRLAAAWGSGMFCSAACETAYEVQF